MKNPDGKRAGRISRSAAFVSACIHCGYQLQGLANPLCCPECGYHVPGLAMVLQGRRHGAGRWGQWVSIVLNCGIALAITAWWLHGWRLGLLLLVVSAVAAAGLQALAPVSRRMLLQLDGSGLHWRSGAAGGVLAWRSIRSLHVRRPIIIGLLAKSRYRLTARPTLGRRLLWRAPLVCDLMINRAEAQTIERAARRWMARTA